LTIPHSSEKQVEHEGIHKDNNTFRSKTGMHERIMTIAHVAHEGIMIFRYSTLKHVMHEGIMILTHSSLKPVLNEGIMIITYSD
jgi:hypothetical protein